jgi:hypothetical protein
MPAAAYERVAAPRWTIVASWIWIEIVRYSPCAEDVGIGIPVVVGYLLNPAVSPLTSWRRPTM